MSRSQVRRSTGTGKSGARNYGDDTGCTILHIDMDAFFALVELRTRPELRGKPVIVGGGSRGVVLSATYEARALGVHSAMPMSRARRLAPQAVVIAPDHRRYAEVSRNVLALFNSITPLVEPLSLDEAFLDISGTIRRLGSPITIAELIRSRVVDEQGITCSVGIATTKFVAKIASARCKPDGVLVVPADQVLAFLHPLSVSVLWGVGERTEEQLTRLGLYTVGDIANTPITTLRRALGQATGSHLHTLAWGIDPRGVTPDEPEKSISAEETFSHDIDDPELIYAKLLHLADEVGTRVRIAGYVSRTIAIKVRFSDFTTVSRSRTLTSPTDVTQELYETARALYDSLGLERVRVRLVGVRAEGLRAADGAAQQLVLGAPDHGRREAEVAVDALRVRFGADAVLPGRLVERADRAENLTE
ncbi:MAG: DNA polymerase IV [Candidatus Nanopelagicales bacterium]|nr:DNA polymerase IV [Candidatus Nanopelagicales bacterium]